MPLPRQAEDGMGTFTCFAYTLVSEAVSEGLSCTLGQLKLDSGVCSGKGHTKGGPAEVVASGKISQRTVPQSRIDTMFIKGTLRTQVKKPVSSGQLQGRASGQGPTSDLTLTCMPR